MTQEQQYEKSYIGTAHTHKRSRGCKLQTAEREVLQGRGIRVPRQDQFVKATLIIQKYGTFTVQTGYYLLNN
jgi:hypothetical protein